MEDFVDVQLREDAFVGVFNGHGGQEAAVYSKTNLWNNIQAEPGFYAENSKEVKDAIVQGFLRTQRGMRAVRGESCFCLLCNYIVLVYIYIYGHNQPYFITIMLIFLPCHCRYVEAIKARGRSQHSRDHCLHSYIQATQHNASCTRWGLNNGFGATGGPCVHGWMYIYFESTCAFQ